MSDILIYQYFIDFPVFFMFSWTLCSKKHHIYKNQRNNYLFLMYYKHIL